MNSPYTFIDLFAGCGGLSEGFYKSNFSALAHIEIDKYCCQTLKDRMKYYDYSEHDINLSVLDDDITSEQILPRIDKAVNDRKVDLIIGGPPCQAYSSAGRARDFYSMKKDPRNYLFKHYVKILNAYKPKLFVFENVLGILTSTINGDKIINNVSQTLGENYRILSNSNDMIFNTADYGVPQNRKRVIIIGARKDLDISVDDIYRDIRGFTKPRVTVRDAISDLPKIKSGCRQCVTPYQYTILNDFINWVRNKQDNNLYDHVCRTQNDVDTERYRQMSLHEWTFHELLQNRPDLSHPKSRAFSNSYVVQLWDQPSTTIVAHICKDGNAFIHPDSEQSRSISVREAARLQSFPDDFRFYGPMTQQFKQIGNAVPPLFAYQIACVLKKYLNKI